jgi:hypothetical protein
MGKGSIVLAALVATALTGCGGSNTAVTPQINALSTTVTVTSGSVPVQGVTVTLSTGISGISPDNPLDTLATDAAGVATFPALPRAGQLCVSATIAGAFRAKCPYPFPAAVALSFD